MVARFRQLPFRAKLSLLLAVYTLTLSILGNLSLLGHIGEVDIGVLRNWSPVEQCYRVSPASSPRWPALHDGTLLINDCLIRVDGLDFGDEAGVQAYLTTIYQGDQTTQYVVIEGKRNGAVFSATIAPMVWTLADILRTQLLIIIPGLALWLTGLMVLLANPRTSQNRALANFLFLGSMALMGADQWFRSPQMRLVFDFLTYSSPRPFFGPLLLLLAMVFPSPVKKTWWRWLTGFLWILAIVAASCKFAEYFIFADQPDLARILDATFNLIVAFNFFVGSSVFVIRSLYLWLHPPSLKVRRQVPFLFIAWLTTIPVITFDTLAQLPGHSWPTSQFTSLSVAGWLIPGAAMIAYAMLRYQAFTYRGRFLNILAIFFISATIVQIYAFIIVPGGLDGLQWTMIWGAVLITTLLFYVSTPVHRSFLRLFARNRYDLETISRFSQTIRKHISLQDLLSSAARMLCTSLEVEWVGIWSPLLPKTFFLAQTDASSTRQISANGVPDDSQFPTPPVHTENMEEGGRLLGKIWFGPRTTAEPFDLQDERLAGLLAQDLARATAVRSYIEQLEATPGVILEAVDRERRRIGQDIHDGVLQFLGSIALSLDRAKRLWQKDPVRADAIIDGVIDQAQVMTDDARQLVYDLSLPGLREGRLVEQAYQHARSVCQGAGVILDWQIKRPELWQMVRNTRAVHVYRILQEGLYNAIRHGHPKHISISLGVEDDDFVLEIVDDGQGAAMDEAQKHPGLGLISMHERARALGGHLWITSQLSQGAMVRLVFPIRLTKTETEAEP